MRRGIFNIFTEGFPGFPEEFLVGILSDCPGNSYKSAVIYSQAGFFNVFVPDRLDPGIDYVYGSINYS